MILNCFVTYSPLRIWKSGKHKKKTQNPNMTRRMIFKEKY